MATLEWMDPQELSDTFGSVGEGVLVDRSVRVVNGKNITIGAHTRIDVDTVLVAGHPIEIGKYIHISFACHFSAAGAPIILEDFASVASRVSIYTATDDFREGYLTNPQVPFEMRNVRTGSVVFRKHAVIGCGGTILPDVELGYGASVGAMSLVSRSVPSGMVYAGIPARQIGLRPLYRLMAFEQAIYANEVKNA